MRKKQSFKEVRFLVWFHFKCKISVLKGQLWGQTISSPSQQYLLKLHSDVLK